MGFSLEDLLAQKQAPPDDSQMAAQTYLASNETPRSLAMNDAPPPMPPPSSPIKSALSSAMSQKPKPDDSDDGDDDTPAPALPAAAKSSGPMLDDLSKYKVTPEELQDAHDSKRAALMMGAIGDGLANQQSWGNYYSGKMNAHNDVMGDAQKFAALADDNIKNKQVLMKQAQAEPSNTLERYKAAMQTQQMQEMQDPNSTTSKLSKTIALGAINQIDFPADQKAEITDAIKKGNAEQINDLVNSNPLLKESFSASVAGKKLAQTMAMMQQRMDVQNKKTDAAQDNKDNKDWEGLANRLNDPSARSKIGAYQSNIDKAGALKTFESTLGMPPGQHAPANETQAQKIARYNRASPQDLYEMSKASDQLISNAGATVSGTEHMMPKDYGIMAGNLRQWVSGGPAPANSGEFIDKFMHTADRERQFYQNARDQAVGKLAGGYSHLKDKDPDRWNTIVGASPPSSSAPPAPSAQSAPAGQDLFSKIGVDPSKLNEDQQKALQQQAQMELIKRRKLAGQ